MKEFHEVRAAIGGIKGVIRALNDAPRNDNWKSFPECPFCKGKKCAGVFEKGGTDLFKCHKTSCLSQCEVLTEVTYIAMREGLNDKHPLTGGPSDAYKRLLQLAGCWEEPGGPGRPMGESSMEVSKKQEPASPAPVSPPPALEPPVDPVRPNPILPPESKTQTDPSNLDEEAIKNAIEVIRVEQRASVELLRRTLHFGYPRAVRILEELEKRGIVGPSNGTDPREILKLPERPIGTHVIKIGDEIHVEKSELKNPELATATAATQKADDKPKLPLGLASLRELFGKLKPTQDQMVPYLEDGGKVPQSIPAAVAKKLKFKPVAMFYTRGLTTITCEALGFRENLPENVALLEQMYQEHPWEELRASGLWLEAEKNNKLGRRPDAQFCGKGQIGRKPEKERRNKDDKWVWGYCSPVLIPYFDEAGDLIKLRPHKGGARGGTMAGRSRIYVPRDYRHCADTVEKFHRVIICEGEFKAAAVWQMLGLGAKLQMVAPDPHQKSLTGEPIPPRPFVDDPDFEAIGVCALPGISYVQHAEMRMDLERWLTDVGARRVDVAFDDEDKSDKPMAQRCEAQICARVLAISLSKQLHLEARVCVLPREWRNSRGKADWDGALAKILGGGK